MAVDSAAKRFSLISFGMVWGPGAVVPDGTIGDGDRFDLIGLYSGFAATEGGVDPEPEPDGPSDGQSFFGIVMRLRRGR